MSRLRIYDDTAPSSPRVDTVEGNEIAQHLREIGVRFERWKAAKEFAPDADQATVIAAYQKDVDRLKRENGYQTVDVIRMLPDNLQKEAFRKKFLNEHTHTEDEVRFFVEGSGVFYLHANEKVHSVLCERGDLMSVPANTTHWFDMGENPRFTCIRLFINPDGWVAHFTGDTIADRFPKFGE